MSGYFLKTPPRQVRKFAVLQEEDGTYRDDDDDTVNPCFEDQLFDTYLEDQGGSGNSDGTNSTTCSTGTGSSGTSSYEEEKHQCPTDKATTAKTTNQPRAIKQRERPSYPVLAPLITPSNNNNGNNNSNYNQDDDFNTRDNEFEMFSLHVEMAKSAFLKNPCHEHWLDLVHSFHMQTMRRQNDENVVSSENIDSENNDKSGHQWANFVVGNADERKEHNNSWVGNSDIGSALSRLEDSIASLEEKAKIHLFHHGDFNSCDEIVRNDDASEEWSEERDVSPPEEISSSSCSEYDPDCISVHSCEEAAASNNENKNASANNNNNNNEEETPITSNTTLTKVVATTTTTKNTNKAYVLNEVQHWEKRIVQYDQRHVNIVAAAALLDEAITSATTASWKVGQIVEVVPSSSSPRKSCDNSLEDGSAGEDDGGEEEILYYVV